MTTADERSALRSVLEDCFGSASSEAAVRRTMVEPDAIDESLWLRLGESGLGVLGVHVPEAYGGAGHGFAELAEVLAAAGATLACVPLLSSAVLATHALLRSGDIAMCEKWLPAMIAGSVRGALAVHEGGAGWSLDPARTSAVNDGKRWRLSGTKNFVVDGGSAHLFVVSAGTAEGPGLFLVAPDAEGIHREALAVLDLTRPLSKITFTDAEAIRLAGPAAAAEVLSEVIQLACVAVAVEEVALAEHVLQTATEYARTRVQFGRPIGSFQAIKHRCADMLIAVETARAVATHAVEAIDAGEPLAVAAPLAKAYCSDAAFAAAAANIQIHGGIGFTWEHSAHLYFKRAKADYLYLGDPAAHRRALARELALIPTAS